VSTPDWIVLCGTLAAFVAYGNWRGRGNRDLTGYLLAGRSLRWPMVALSVMATQASAITFLSTPGQGYADGLRFVQFYFGLPLAMVVLCAIAIPAYHRARVFTAYEYLERRFDAKTRTLASALFLLQRGLAAGVTIYAPALVLSVLLGWDVRWTCVLLGALVAIAITSGGSRAVGHAHVLQFAIIMGTMVVAFVMIVRALPPGVGWLDATAIAGRLGRLNAVNTAFDPNDRYNLWSGLIGGFFLQFSYFGTDQSQVGRYLGGQSIAHSRLGLLFNGLFKLPMQFFILFVGVMVFAFYQFAPSPLFFDPVESHRMAAGPQGDRWRDLEQRHARATEVRRGTATAFVEARRSGDAAELAAAERSLAEGQREVEKVRVAALAAIHDTDPAAQTSDTNYVFLAFVLHHLPTGLIGLVLAAMFAASMNSSSAEMHALTSTTVVDVYKRLHGGGTAWHEVVVSRFATVLWCAFAVGFAEFAARLGSLIEAVNILGSLFYGTMLGMFLTAFLLKRVRGTAVFWAAIVAEAAVIACFKLTKISFLWYNVVGCVVVMGVAMVLSAVFERRRIAIAPA
jgi:Na+/proline symporter